LRFFSWLLQHVLWHGPSQAPEVACLVFAVTEPLLVGIAEVEGEAQAARQEAQAETLLVLAAAADKAGGGAGNEGQSAQYRREAATLQAQAQAARQEAEAQIAQALNAGPSDQAIHRAVKQAAEATADPAGSLDGWGLAPP